VQYVSEGPTTEDDKDVESRRDNLVGARIDNEMGAKRKLVGCAVVDHSEWLLTDEEGRPRRQLYCMPSIIMDLSSIYDRAMYVSDTISTCARIVKPFASVYLLDICCGVVQQQHS
jgi:hypothetical protein